MLIKVKETERIRDEINARIDTPSLMSANLNDEQFTFVHAQNIEPILAACNEQRKESDTLAHNLNEWEKIATIPDIEYLRHPEWNHDPNALLDWLKSDEGKRYRTSRRAI